MHLSQKRVRWSHAIGFFIAVMALPLASQARPTDAEITGAVEHEIELDRGVTVDNIDVVTVDGVVMLEGTARSVLERERAKRIASIVKGVREVVNKLEVKPSREVPDEELQQSIKNALLADPATDLYEVEVSVDGGTAVLTGTVDSWKERELVAEVTKEQEGVKEITNNIDIGGETDRPDAEIKEDVEQSLAWNSLIDDSEIEIQVEDGTVSFSGTVGSAAEKARVYGEAWVAGVTSVKADGLKVAGWSPGDGSEQQAEPAEEQQTEGQRAEQQQTEDREDRPIHPRDDETIENAVGYALSTEPRVKEFDVEVKIKDGDVTLRGTVDNLKAKRAAEQTARQIEGVDQIDNRLDVRPEDSPDDAAIEERIQAALMRNPYANQYQIDVDVTDGVAQLNGDVESHFQRGLADDIASRAPGVTEVENQLVVADDFDPYYANPYVSPYSWYDYKPENTATASQEKSDMEIKKDVMNQFFWSPFVEERAIEVSVDEGNVTLEGVVESWSERAAATENAFEGGAAAVDNNLRVAQLE